MIIPESKAKWFTDINKRKYLLQKANLIDLFTIADLPIVEDNTTSFSVNRNIGDIVDYTDYNYKGYDFVNPKYSSINILSDSTIAITVFNENYDRYTKGNVYTLPEIADKITEISNYKVLKVDSYTNIREHPYLNTFTDNFKNELYRTSSYQIVTLEKVLNKFQYKGYDLFTDKHYVFGVDYTKDNDIRYIVLSKYGEPAFSIYDEIVLHSGDIENYITEDDTTITTTLGRYIANYFMLASPFRNVIPYKNEEMSIGKIEAIIADKILNGVLTTEQGGQYLNNTFFIGSFGEMAIPGLSKKALMTSPEVKQRKKELLEKYKDKLDDPIILAQIEDELIKLDKEWLKGDSSMGFYGDTGKKFNVHRKKQYVIGGLIEDFTKEKGKYDFITNSLSDGWDINSFATICNEIRKGSYNRGIDTARGGALSKNLLRVVQNLEITGDDCGTNEYLTINLTEDLVPKFYNRWVLDPSNNKEELLTKDNQFKYLNKSVKIRSLMYCHQKDGFCHKCAGEMFKTVGQDVIGVLALELTSTFLMLSMKAMHGQKLTRAEITELSKFVV